LTRTGEGGDITRIDEAIDRFLWWVGRQSGTFVAVLAAATYGGAGLALPLILGWPTNWLIGANVTGTLLAGLFVLMWIANGVQANYRRRLVEWTTDLRHLNAQEFEWLVGELFRREGWTVSETGSHSGPDGNVDLRLANSQRQVIVQCKRWESWLVGVDEIRELGGTLMREGLTGDAGIFVTLSGSTDPARAEAKVLGLELIDGQDLYARLERARRPEPCPMCANPMRLGRSEFGWWFRCTSAGCKGKRDLGRDPARVVGLLVQQPD
jgi:hypothetical protein